MNQQTACRIIEIQEALLSDGQYAKLLREYKEVSSNFLKALAAMTEAEQTVIYDYLGITAQMHLHMLEKACQ